MQNLLAGGGSSVPSIASGARNALAMKSAQLRNVLAEKKIGTFDEDREAQKKLREIQTEATAISTALRAINTKQATEIYNSLGGKSKSGISITGKDVSMDYGDNTFSGPMAAVSELMENISKDPTWANNPKTKAWSAARGISSIQSKAALAKLKKTPGVAGSRAKSLKRISDIQKAKATLEKTDMVTQMLAKDNPELAQYVGQKIPPELKASLMDAWDNELDYHEQFSGTTRKKEVTPTGSTVTHTFIPGQGLVPTQ